MWVKDKFTQPGKILKQLKIFLVGFFLFSASIRMRGFGKIQKVTNDQKTKPPIFSPHSSFLKALIFPNTELQMSRQKKYPQESI